MIRFISIFFYLVSFNLFASNQTIHHFSEAKKILFKKLFNSAETRKTIYCGCSFNQKKRIDESSCGIKVRLDKKRAFRVEVEHIVPTHAFGKSFIEWREGHPDCIFKKGKKKGKKFHGRKCASSVNSTYQLMEADLYNLYPVEGEMNKDRNNFSMAEISTPVAQNYGKCLTKIDINLHKVEPRQEMKGHIARAYLYMNGAYPQQHILSDKNAKLFEVWDQQNPPTERECEWGKSVQIEQKNLNPFLQSACVKKFGKY